MPVAKTKKSKSTANTADELKKKNEALQAEIEKLNREKYWLQLNNFDLKNRYSSEYSFIGSSVLDQLKVDFLRENWNVLSLEDLESLRRLNVA